VLYLNNFIDNGIDLNEFSPSIDPDVDDFGNPISRLGSMLTGSNGLSADPIPSFDTEGATITCQRSPFADPTRQVEPATHTIFLVSPPDQAPKGPGRFAFAPIMTAELQFDLPNSFVLDGSKPSSEPSTNTWAVALLFKTGSEQDAGTDMGWGGTCQFRGGAVNLNSFSSSDDIDTKSQLAMGPFPYSHYQGSAGIELPKKGELQTIHPTPNILVGLKIPPTLFKLRVVIDRTNPASSLGTVTLSVGDTVTLALPIPGIPNLNASSATNSPTAVGISIANQAMDKSTQTLVAPAAVSVRLRSFLVEVIGV
jgi:hypothetical protein